MAFTSWRGTLGCIKPTKRPGSLEELIRMLPEGIGVVPLYLSINKGTTEEFKRSVEPFEPLVKELAELECDLIHPEGAPPFMFLGYKGEAELLKKWEKKYKIPMFTSGTNHVRALKALKAKKIVGATYFTGEINNLFAKYFKEAGFNVLAWTASMCRLTRFRISRQRWSTPISRRCSSNTRAPTRSTCSAPAGACCR